MSILCYQQLHQHIPKKCNLCLQVWYNVVDVDGGAYSSCDGVSSDDDVFAFCGDGGQLFFDFVIIHQFSTMELNALVLK